MGFQNRLSKLIPAFILAEFVRGYKDFFRPLQFVDPIFHLHPVSLRALVRLSVWNKTNG